METPEGIWGLSSWVSVTHAGDLDQAPLSFGLSLVTAQPQPLWAFGEWTSPWEACLFVSFPPSQLNHFPFFAFPIN